MRWPSVGDDKFCSSTVAWLSDCFGPKELRVQRSLDLVDTLAGVDALAG